MSRSPVGRPTAVSFTGGKDSMLVLHLLRSPPTKHRCSKPFALQEPSHVNGTVRREGWLEVQARLDACGPCDVKLLVTFVPAGGKAFKAHPLELITLQAEALGLRHIVKEISAPFLESYRAAIASLQEDYGISALATGDIEDVCEGFMGRACVGTGVELLTPLWSIDRSLLLGLAWHYGLEAVISCVNTSKFEGPALGCVSDGTASTACARRQTSTPAQSTGQRLGTDTRCEGDVAAAAAAAVHGGAHAGVKRLALLASSVSGTAAPTPVTSTTQTTPTPSPTPQQHASNAAANTSSDAVNHSLSSSGVGVGAAHSAQASNASDPAVGGATTALPAAGDAPAQPAGSAFDISLLLGQTLSPELLRSVLLPAKATYGVDECGEGGEFHTMVVGGALFGGRRIAFEHEALQEGDFAFLRVTKPLLQAQQ